MSYWGYAGGYSSVQAEEHVVDGGCDWHDLEEIQKCQIDLLVVLMKAFLAKVKIWGHMLALMIASQQDDLLRPINFQT